MFKRPHHQRISTLLQSLDENLFVKASTYFGGGTAIALLLDEYRESVDVYFLCSSSEGYRLLRETVHEKGFSGLAKVNMTLARDIRMDRYGIRTIVLVDDVPIKFEIVAEGRIHLTGEKHNGLNVPVLSRIDMYAEKLLANSDRFADEAVKSRDIIDLGMMVTHWGLIPNAAWQKAEKAYGTSVKKDFSKAVSKLKDADYAKGCFDALKIDQTCIVQIKKSLERQDKNLAHDDLELGL